jgi:hypothetical protein
MDLRNLLGKLDTLAEGAMTSAKQKPTGPKFTGKWKGTDPAKAAKDKYVGGMEESIFHELEATLKKDPVKRDLVREYQQFKEDVPPAPGQQPNAQQTNVPGKPTLGADVGKQQAQQAQQNQQQAKQQADAAKQAKMQQSNLQKGVNTLKSAGAAISNASQTVQAFNKVDANGTLTPGDKNNIASAGTVLAPIMANQQLAGKFKDLVTQASNDEKKQQQQAQQAQAPQQPVQGQQPPAGTVK